MSEPEADAARRLQDLLERMDATVAALDATEDPERAVEQLQEMAALAREVQAEIDRLRADAPDAPA